MIQLYTTPYTLKTQVVGSDFRAPDLYSTQGRFSWVDFASILEHHDAVPDRKGAPLSSWILARVVRIADDFPENWGQDVDGGGYIICFSVELGDTLVASIELQGWTVDPTVLGRGAPGVSTPLKNAFVKRLLAEPAELGSCCYKVSDPIWKSNPNQFTPTPNEGSVNVYGWNLGHGFFGAGNIVEQRSTAFCTICEQVSEVDLNGRCISCHWPI